MAVKHGTLLSCQKKVNIMWNEYTKKNLVPLYENNLRWRLRNNEDLYELLCGHDMVKYIQKITMSWSYAWYIWIILEHQKSIERKILWKKMWENSIRRNSFLLLNMRGWRWFVKDRTIWRWPIEDCRAWCGLFRHWGIRVQYCNKAR